MADAGLVKGDRLALLSHNCWQFAVLDFATARLGVVLVPVNFMLGADEVAFILDHSGATRVRRRGRAGEVAERALAAASAGSARGASIRLAGAARAGRLDRRAGVVRPRRRRPRGARWPTTTRSG